MPRHPEILNAVSLLAARVRCVGSTNHGDCVSAPVHRREAGPVAPLPPGGAATGRAWKAQRLAYDARTSMVWQLPFVRRFDVGQRDILL